MTEPSAKPQPMNAVDALPMQFLGAFERQLYRQRTDERAGSKGKNACEHALGQRDIQAECRANHR